MASQSQTESGRDSEILTTDNSHNNTYITINYKTDRQSSVSVEPSRPQTGAAETADNPIQVPEPAEPAEPSDSAENFARVSPVARSPPVAPVLPVVPVTRNARSRRNAHVAQVAPIAPVAPATPVRALTRHSKKQKKPGPKTTKFLMYFGTT